MGSLFDHEESDAREIVPPPVCGYKGKLTDGVGETPGSDDAEPEVPEVGALPLRQQLFKGISA